MLKGGGCENVGAQYSLPDTRLDADRDLEGVRRAVLDAVQQAQGMGCAPGVIGVAVGGDRGVELHQVEGAVLPAPGRRERGPEAGRDWSSGSRTRPTRSASGRWASAARPRC